MPQPAPASVKTGKKVAVVGSDPAGLAAAQQLARAGHDVTVFEKCDRIGGLLRYGIPDFKLEKNHIDRRIEQMQTEGVKFRTSVLIGKLRTSSSHEEGCSRDWSVATKRLEGKNGKVEKLVACRVGEESIRGRGHAARAIAGGVGDPRRAAMRSGGGRVLDGEFGVAEVMLAFEV